MTPPRRQFLAASAATAASGALAPAQAQTTKPALNPPPFRLGMVTYNGAAQGDLPTILKVCKTVGIAAVECRTTHKEGVEPAPSAEQPGDRMRPVAAR